MGMVDIGTGVLDTGTGVLDTEVLDRGTGVVDRGTGVVDRGTGVLDRGTGVVHTGTGVVAEPGGRGTEAVPKVPVAGGQGDTGALLALQFGAGRRWRRTQARARRRRDGAGRPAAAGRCPSGHVEDIELAGVLEGLAAVAEPHAHHLALVAQLLRDARDLGARGQRVALEVRVERLEGLRGEGRAPLALLARLASHELQQVLLPLALPLLRLPQPLLQHRLQLLRALGRDVQLLEPGDTGTLRGHLGGTQGTLGRDVLGLMSSLSNLRGCGGHGRPSGMGDKGTAGWDWG
ncbi:hypothetical protein DV515_00017481 [Chloebia gouldiae]|uniref:Uncharacterized protein n=1 Tax=Chloebia gouldiae TaxID=44316 RepID=A0A3L8QAP9_CHLGU|nr:hypothetical protein DV515_00017479 [Chloebia gouldiae]RLV64451.1 hypothetical protein DV515_00017481 [Chloebia gouldiae]